MNMQSNPPQHDAELAWLAEQYVLGELTAGELGAFEERLATEQPAREAMANAVALLGGVRVAEATLTAPVSLTVRGASSGWASRIAWFSGVAAALALAAFLVWRVNFGEHERTTALAGAWSETRDSIDEDHPEEVIAMSENGDTEIEDLDVPDWLVTAVSLRDETAVKPERSPLKPDAGEGA